VTQHGDDRGIHPSGQGVDGDLVTNGLVDGHNLGRHELLSVQFVQRDLDNGHAVAPVLQDNPTDVLTPPPARPHRACPGGEGSP
jgi:hypothetical protein